ncbi:hypothetical protein AMATHDRAFT_41557 [Amanita thiersii Skay4041]|uniref:Uncharacterized protein n=1 Tax=Amanita thiersii Skay4041 TaxID=703135 RepID=A0A2A9NP37_9AGAR|nr:hypothetical protein AMATHDRAFT_41557 [Amanita thiersii Skay4041]
MNSDGDLDFYIDSEFSESESESGSGTRSDSESSVDIQPEVSSNSLPLAYLSHEFTRVLELLNEKQSCYSIDIVDKDAPNPWLKIEGVGSIGIPLSERDARLIIDRAIEIASSKNQDNQDSGCVWEIEAPFLECENPDWKVFLEHKLNDNVRSRIQGPSEPFNFELCKLILHGAGSTPTKYDVSSSDSAIGSLLITLPSHFIGGQIQITYNSQTQTYEPSTSFYDGATALAWYNVAGHYSEPVNSGYRFSLLYKIIRPPPAVSELLLPNIMQHVESELSRLLSLWSTAPKGTESSSDLVAVVLQTYYFLEDIKTGTASINFNTQIGRGMEEPGCLIFMVDGWTQARAISHTWLLNPSEEEDPDFIDYQDGWHDNMLIAMNCYYRTVLVIFKEDDKEKIMFSAYGLPYALDKLSTFKDIGTATLSEVFENFGIRRTLPLYEDLISREVSLGHKVQFIHDLSKHASRIDDQFQVVQWTNHQIWRAIVDYEGGSDYDVRAIVTLAHKGWAMRLCNLGASGHVFGYEFATRLASVLHQEKQTILASVSKQSIEDGLAYRGSQPYSMYIDALIGRFVNRSVEASRIWLSDYPCSIGPRNLHIQRVVCLVRLCAFTQQSKACERVLALTHHSRSLQSTIKFYYMPLVSELRKLFPELRTGPCWTPLSQYMQQLIGRYLTTMLGTKTYNPRLPAFTPFCSCKDCAQVFEFLRQTYVPRQMFKMSMKAMYHILRKPAIRRLAMAMEVVYVNGCIRGVLATKSPKMLKTVRWEGRLKQARKFLAAIGTDEEIALIMGDRYPALLRALEGTERYPFEDDQLQLC